MILIKTNNFWATRENLKRSVDYLVQHCEIELEIIIRLFDDFAFSRMPFTLLISRV